MDLNEYIRQSYKRPNRRILETLGANEELIEYLMETPGNTNWNVVGSIGESDEGDWTTIRLEYSNDQSLFPEPHLVSKNPQDIQNFYILYNMCMNNEHPIIIINGVTHGTEIRNNPITYATNSLWGEDGKFIVGGIIYVMIRDAKNDNDELFLYNQLDNNQGAHENDYIEIKFKTGNYYTLSIPDILKEITYSVEQNSSWNIGTFLTDVGTPGYGFTDGINTYFDGDTIVFNKDMTLNLVEPE